ncbi:hypothetical protein ZWY2020_016898, partial [Hordeum vulgare]
CSDRVKRIIYHDDLQSILRGDNRGTVAGQMRGTVQTQWQDGVDNAGGQAHLRVQNSNQAHRQRHVRPRSSSSYRVFEQRRCRPFGTRSGGSWGGSRGDSWDGSRRIEGVRTLHYINAFLKPGITIYKLFLHWQWLVRDRRYQTEPSKQKTFSEHRRFISKQSMDEELILIYALSLASASPWSRLRPVRPNPRPATSPRLPLASSAATETTSHHEQQKWKLASKHESSNRIGEANRGALTGGDTEAGTRPSTADRNYKITEEMMQEMDYNADRTWYDCEGHSTISNAGNYLGDDGSFQNKKTKLSKKLSQITAENAQWENRQLFRSGAVRRTEVQMEFDDEDGTPFLDGRVVFTKQAEPVMPLKDPTSDMAIIARKGSLLIDADTAVVGDQGDVDFKHKLKFSQHWKEKAEAVSDFAKSKSLSQQRQYLPIYTTTQPTQYLHEDGYTRTGLVGCTQPRRVAAMSVAQRVSEEMETVLGDEVGYAIRFEDVTPVLLRETLKDSDLDKYRVIIMDEAHERSLNTDVLFGILKKVAARRRDFKLIVTSATLNADKFSKFFGGAPVFHIPGRTFPVNILFNKMPCEDYVEAAVKQAIAIHITSGPGDILIFMTGRRRLTNIFIHQGCAKLSILPIYSRLPADLQAKIFQKAGEGTRKCIVATNIAEASLTVDGIFYVADTGQAAADQRAGRAGRTGPGTCYRLFTNQLTRMRCSLTLCQRSKGPTFERGSLEIPQSRKPENILNSMYQLWLLGALNNVGGLTNLGWKMVEFPLDNFSKMLLMRAGWGASMKCNNCIHALSAINILRPKDREEEVALQGEVFKRLEVRSQLLDILKTLKIPLTSCHMEWDVVRKAICSAYFQNSARLKGVGSISIAGMGCVPPASQQRPLVSATPDYIVYHELVLTTKDYMQCVSAVEHAMAGGVGPCSSL